MNDKNSKIRDILRKEKVSDLQSILTEMKSVLIAFSGGVDSTFLLKIAKETLENNVLAVTADSAIFPSSEISDAKKIAKDLGVRHRVIEVDLLKRKDVRKNPENRCYYCKKNLFEEFSKIAENENLNQVVDGTTSDDFEDYRPGLRAVRELGVRSPLAEAGLVKEEVRRFSKELEIPVWDKPSTSCLATRISYGTKINKGLLGKIEKLEDFLKKLGFRTVRVRHHQNIARIEVSQNSLGEVIENREKILEKFRKENYDYVTLDLDGYNEGSMNKELGE